jgi:crotonobetainyl-CoA:carnitine CoA-transferase CaiB-like acyl-CoA transferase
MAGTPNHLRTPPCRLGEHNEEIYLGLLGYSREELGALEARGLVGTSYSATIAR